MLSDLSTFYKINAKELVYSWSYLKKKMIFSLSLNWSDDRHVKIKMICENVHRYQGKSLAKQVTLDTYCPCDPFGASNGLPVYGGHMFKCKVWYTKHSNEYELNFDRKKLIFRSGLKTPIGSIEWFISELSPYHYSKVWPAQHRHQFEAQQFLIRTFFVRIGL